MFSVEQFDGRAWSRLSTHSTYNAAFNTALGMVREVARQVVADPSNWDDESAVAPGRFIRVAEYPTFADGTVCETGGRVVRAFTTETPAQLLG